MHFHPGNIPVAFVFSAPGSKEKECGVPVAGTTGENLEWSLERLAAARPDLFPSPHRYDYRITNAYAAPLAKVLGDTRTEASRREVLLPENVTRVKRELGGCKLVILCGGKAGHLEEALTGSGFQMVRCSHTSNQALVSVHNAAGKQGSTPQARRRLRALAWAEHLLGRLKQT
jgi:uracil-DNA glycosylase